METKMRPKQKKLPITSEQYLDYKIQLTAAALTGVIPTIKWTPEEEAMDDCDLYELRQEKFKRAVGIAESFAYETLKHLADMYPV